MLVKSEKKFEESGEVRFNERCMCKYRQFLKFHFATQIFYCQCGFFLKLYLLNLLLALFLSSPVYLH